MKIVFLDTKTVGNVPNLDILDQFGDVTLYETTSPEQTAERIDGAEIVITNKVVLDRKVIEGAERLKLICVAATGMNNIDREAASKQKVEVKNVEGYASVSVAQVTFTMLLHLLCRITYYDDYVKRGDYSKSDIFTHLGSSFNELAGKRFGILGLGNIGRQVAKIAEAFGAEVVYYSASGKNTDQPWEMLGLEEFLRTSDIVSIHAPLNKHTDGLINFERLSLMKPSAILLNSGRGGIVIEEDLARALDKSVITAAGVDVFENEPINSDNPLLTLKNKDRIVLTPHIAWSSREARTQLMEGIGRNIREFLQDDA